MAETPIIETIKGKIDRIVADNRRLAGENRKLSEQRDRLKADSKELLQRIAQLEKRIDVLELSDSLGATSGDKKKARARVNRLMREVDKCIALLNR